MIPIIYIGGPYHGHRGSETIDSDGNANLTGQQGVQHYVRFHKVENVHFYRYHALRVDDALKLAATVKL